MMIDREKPLMSLGRDGETRLVGVVSCVMGRGRVW